MGQFLHGAAEQIITRACQKHAVAIVDEAHPVGSVDYDDAGLGLLSHGSEALLAFT